MEILLLGVIQMLEKDVDIMFNITDHIHYVHNVYFDASFL